MAETRHSLAREAALITEPLEVARKEAANSLEQTDQVQKLIASHVVDGRPVVLRPSTILGLNRSALDGISKYAGVWRPSDIEIGQSKHTPPKAHLVPELIEHMCDYVNGQWGKALPVHLASFVMWRINWIHPFVDGNGRTSRAVSYLVLSVATGMLLPGSKTIPEQIVANRQPYYEALEAADEADLKGFVNVTALEKMMSDMLASQLLSVSQLASGDNYN